MTIPGLQDRLRFLDSAPVRRAASRLVVGGGFALTRSSMLFTIALLARSLTRAEFPGTLVVLTIAGATAGYVGGAVGDALTVSFASSRRTTVLLVNAVRALGASTAVAGFATQSVVTSAVAFVLITAQTQVAMSTWRARDAPAMASAIGHWAPALSRLAAAFLAGSSMDFYLLACLGMLLTSSYVRVTPLSSEPYSARALWTGLVLGLTYLTLQQSDVVALGVLGHREAVASYVPSMRLLEAASLGTTILAFYVPGRARRTSVRATRRLSRYAFASYLICGGLVVLVGPHIIGPLLDDQATWRWALAGPLFAGYLLLAPAALWLQRLVIQGCVRAIALLGCATAAANVSLLVALVPRYGAIGAAVANGISYGVLSLLTFAVSARIFTVPPDLSKHVPQAS